MQIACEVRRVLMKNKNQISIEKFKLQFVDKNSKPKVSKETLTQWAKARWVGVVSAYKQRQIDRHKAAAEKKAKQLEAQKKKRKK